MTAQKKLKLLLFEKGVSQRKLAKESGIPESHISYFMHDKFKLNKSQQKKVAKVLGKKPEEIFKKA